MSVHNSATFPDVEPKLREQEVDRVPTKGRLETQEEHWRVPAGAWVVASLVAFGAVACAVGEEGDVAPQVAPTRSGSGPGAPVEQVGTLDEAVSALEATIQDVYHLDAITPRAASLLLERVGLCVDAYEAGDAGEAFAHLNEAHAMVDSGLVSSDEAAVRLHRSLDLIGAVIAANPPS